MVLDSSQEKVQTKPPKRGIHVVLSMAMSQKFNVN